MIRLKNSDIAMALIAIGCGGFVLLMSAGVIPGEMAGNTPRWIGALAGFVFVIAGAMIFLRNHSGALDLFAAVVLAAFALMASWVAVYGAEGITGGVPFLPHDTNITIGRVMFAFGAALCFGLFLFAMQRFFKSHK